MKIAVAKEIDPAEPRVAASPDTVKKFKALGVFGLIEMLIFLVILIVGYIWVWAKGALEWV